jgi:Uri superfamily endonuclease
MQSRQQPAPLILHQKQQKTMTGQQITFSGSNERQGTYLLFISLSKTVRLAFGSFMKGKTLLLPAGHYLYLGSALGNGDNSFPLARRLIRHTSRTGDGNPHAIRKALQSALRKNRLAGDHALGIKQKKLHWHIDYLLECPESRITHIVIIRKAEKLEPVLSRYLEAHPDTSVFAQRLGAQDTKNSTHLLQCNDPDALREQLLRDLPGIVSACDDHSC